MLIKHVEGVGDVSATRHVVTAAPLAVWTCRAGWYFMVRKLLRWKEQEFRTWSQYPWISRVFCFQASKRGQSGDAESGVYLRKALISVAKQQDIKTTDLSLSWLLTAAFSDAADPGMTERPVGSLLSRSVCPARWLHRLKWEGPSRNAV